MPVYAQDDIAFNINSGYLGLGWDFPMNDGYNSLGSFALLNVGIELEPTNIGFEFSPFKYYNWKDSDDNEREDYSFFNLNLYWNVFTLLGGAVYFGPFASVNYFFVNENIYWDRYIFTAGGRVGFRINSDGLNYDLLSAEVGYRNIDGANKFFIGVKVDVLAFFVFCYVVGSSYYSSSK
jgi:hypothetical protein